MLATLNDLDLGSLHQRPSGLYIPRRPKRHPVGIDLFAGAGGMSVGFHQAGFHMIAAVEIDPWAVLTYAINLARPGVRIHFDTDDRRRQFERALERHLGVNIDKNGYITEEAAAELRTKGTQLAGSGWISSYGKPWDPDSYPNEFLADINQPPVHPHGCEHIWVYDVRNLTGQMILDAIGMEQGEVDVVTGGPPCQGFSRAGKRNVMDPRNSLVFDFARLVLEIRPKTFLFENVPGIVSMVTPEGIPVLDALARVFDDGGFGSYEAIKQSLLTTSGVGAVMQGTGGTKDDDPEADPVEQSTLF